MPARRWLFLVLIFCAMAVSSVTFLAMADDTTTCPALVSSALNELGTNCADLARNTTCLGNDNARHTAFAKSVSAEFYTRAGDRADLTITEAIQTGSMNIPERQWGLNVMNVEANIPNALTGRRAWFSFKRAASKLKTASMPNDAVDAGEWHQPFDN